MAGFEVIIYGRFWVIAEEGVEISESSSITSEEGYLILAPSGVRLLDTGYVRELVAEYQTARERKEALRKHLLDLGEPDPE